VTVRLSRLRYAPVRRPLQALPKRLGMPEEPGEEVKDFAAEAVALPREAVQEGDVVKVRIIRIDPARKRIGLSMRQSEGDAPADAPDAGCGAYRGTTVFLDDDHSVRNMPLSVISVTRERPRSGNDDSIALATRAA